MENSATSQHGKVYPQRADHIGNDFEMHRYTDYQEGYAYVFTARFQTDPLEQQFSKYRQMSGGRFLVGLREAKNNEGILALKSLFKESISF